MPRARPVAPLSVNSLQEASEPVTLPVVTDTFFDPPPPEDARKLRSSPEAARKRQTLPAAVANAPPPGYHSVPRRLPPTVMAREIALALGELTDAPRPRSDGGEDDDDHGTTATDSPQRYTDATQSLSTPRGQSSALGHVEAAATAGDTDDFAPPPPPPAGQDGAASSRFLASETGRPRGVASTADNFRLAVWTYSPRKKQRNAAAATVAADDADDDTSFTPSPVAAPSYLNTSLPPEVFDIAFGFLSISDLAIASQVCRAWFVAADPWAYTEQHGWVPLGPLSRATHILLRIAPHDQRVTPDLLRCIKFGCKRLTLELGGSVAAAAAALPALVTAPRRTPARSGYHDVTEAVELSDETPPLIQLRELCLERPSPEDLRILKQRLLPRTPVLAELRLNRVSLPVGAREIVDLVRGTKVRELRLQRVTNVTRSTLHGLFQGAQALAVLHLEQCVFVGDRERGGGHQRPPPPALGGSARPRPSLTPTGIAPMPPSINASVSAPSAKFRVTGRIVAARAGSSAAVYRVLEMVQHGGGAEARGGPRTARKPSAAAELPGGPCMACMLQGVPCDEHEQQQQPRALPAAMPAAPQPHRFASPHHQQHQQQHAPRYAGGTHTSPPRQFLSFAPPSAAMPDQGHAVGAFGAHRPNAPMSGNFGNAFGSPGYHHPPQQSAPAGVGGYQPSMPRPPALAPRLPGALFDARTSAGARSVYAPPQQHQPPQVPAAYPHTVTSDHRPLPPLPLHH
jgi:hypothetical protein